MKTEVISLALLSAALILGTNLVSANGLESQIPFTISGVSITDKQPVTSVLDQDMLKDLHIKEGYVVFYGDLSSGWAPVGKGAVAFFLQFESSAYLESSRETVDEGIMLGISQNTQRPTVTEVQSFGGCKIKTVECVNSGVSLVGYTWSKDDTHVGIIATDKVISDELLRRSCGGVPPQSVMSGITQAAEPEFSTEKSPLSITLIQVALAALLVVMMHFMKAYRH